MKLLQNLFYLVLITSIVFASGQVKAQITKGSGPDTAARGHILSALNNYITGSSFNSPEQIKNAFHPEARLILQNDSKSFWSVEVNEYTSWFKNRKQGRPNGRIGEVLSIDVEGKVATAKVEILLPAKQRRYVDMFLLKEIDGQWQIISKTAGVESSVQNGERILFIVSNAHFHGELERPAGASFSELVSAYHTFKINGYTVDFVSPEGGAVPLAYINTSNELHKQYLYDEDFMYALKYTKRPEQVLPENYKAVHYIGGSNAMYGVAENEAIQAISMEIYEKHQGIISSVCHGTAGIVHLKNQDGSYLVSGKRISGYPDEWENPNAAYYQQFPFQIEKIIERRNGDFRYGKKNTSYVEVDGRVITGQNFQSSEAVALKIIEQLQAAGNLAP